MYLSVSTLRDYFLWQKELGFVGQSNGACISLVLGRLVEGRVIIGTRTMVSINGGVATVSQFSSSILPPAHFQAAYA